MSQGAPEKTIEQKTLEQEKSGTSDTLCFAVIDKSSHCHPLYWISIDDDSLNDSLNKALNAVAVDPSYQTGILGGEKELEALRKDWSQSGFKWLAQRQFLPGVTDNLAHTIEEALRLMGISPRVKIASGSLHLFGSQFKTNEQILDFARYKLFHPLVESFKIESLVSNSKSCQLLPFPQVSLTAPQDPESIDLDLSDEKLVALSKNRLLALSLTEMRTIKEYFETEKTRQARKEHGLKATPTDVELEILAQTWSEHCKHKIFNADIEYTEQVSTTGSGEAHEHHRFVKSIYKTFIKGATKKLMGERADLLSVFKDNSGVVRWSDDWAVCFKVETHNSPSALEPFGGALTGILGVNRDILGTGLGASPIFNTNVFCFASPDSTSLAMRPKLLPPETIPRGVRHGVEDGGNKSGIPTVNGAIFFDDGYRAKPLVFCGTGGLLPILQDDLKMYEKHTRPGDSIIVAGGRVGKDGIHGATFSSEALHEGSPVTAVQIGDPFTQKRLIDFVLAARDRGLITGITDNGAGGLSSSVGEMASITGGASIDLARVPLKYPGLSDWEIVVSESQERMTLSTKSTEELIALAVDYAVEAVCIGQFDESGCFEVKRDDKVLARLDLDFLHDGNPTLALRAHWQPTELTASKNKTTTRPQAALLELLGHENIASREEIIRQYDHEVQGQSVIKPLMGLDQRAPCDAAVLKPLYDRDEGLVVSNGLCPQWSKFDTYSMASFAVDEAIRNACCVGADPDTISLLDNFCWPDPVAAKSNTQGAYKLGQLVRACQGLFDACLAFKAPLISGKDSMKNDFDDSQVRLSIPPTLLISAIAKIDDCNLCQSMEFKQEGDLIYLLTCGSQSLTGSHYSESFGLSDRHLPDLDFKAAPELYRKLHQAIKKELLHSAHDVSEGGLLVAIAESVLGGRMGADIDLSALSKSTQRQPSELNTSIEFMLFAEGPSRIIISLPEKNKKDLLALDFAEAGVELIELGTVSKETRLKVKNDDGSYLIDLSSDELTKAFCRPLPIKSRNSGSPELS